MFYTIIHSPEFKLDCHRCGRPLAHAVQMDYDGKTITVGRECAKHYGITWTAKIGPLADDPAMFRQAVEIHKEHQKHGAWPNGWNACQIVKEAIGAIAWQSAAIEAMSQRGIKTTVNYQTYVRIEKLMGR